ncbi:acyltransferase [Bacteroides acidifaciens]|uniref:acyltransferase n=1 Tax=Bacteroides acidifaciens TaxID=85831 RepID=UPI002557C97C|nr:acyltransferase family protein [Bacteroides acidifaciens]
MKQREIGPDIIRTLAIVCVVCGHFFTVNTPYNQVLFEGGGMLLQGCLKAFFCNLGVPLFLMLTGYFNCQKEFSAKYYKNIKRVLLPYVVISILTWIVLSANHSIKELVGGILGYKIIGYAWYVEMFIGLYLCVPFLNIVVEKVFNSGNKKLIYGLFVILIFMTSLPPLVNRGEFRIVPNYWQMCFPVLLYFTGAYIRNFQPVIKHKTWAVLAIGLVYLQYPLLNYLKISLIGEGNLPNVFGPYYALPGYIAMTLLFVSLYKVDIKTEIIRKAVTDVSLVSDEMFLFSYLYDRLIYPWAMERFYTNQNSFIVWFVPITLTVLLTSYIMALIYRKISGLLESKNNN